MASSHFWVNYIYAQMSATSRAQLSGLVVEKDFMTICGNVEN